MIYDPETNILCLKISKGTISHVREFGNFIIHVSKSEKPILIEILDATKFINKFEKIKNINNLKQVAEAIK